MCSNKEDIQWNRHCQSKRTSDGGDKSETITEIMRKTQIFGETCGFCSCKFSESELLFENAYSLHCLTVR